MAPGDELGWRQPGLGPCSGQRLRGKAREGHVVAGQAAASDRGGSSHREQSVTSVAGWPSRSRW